MDQEIRKKEWSAGFKAGIPIMLGYLSVSFGVGIKAHQIGMSFFEAAFMSLTNLTSAGQAAGMDIIAAGGSMIEMALTQLVINLRYALMSLSLTQKTDENFRLSQKLRVSYGVTDEIFAVASGRMKRITPQFMYGITMISAFGWVLGTFLGAVAGDVLPTPLTDALGIMLYGMFIAIFVPAAKHDRHISCVVLAAVVISLFFHYILPMVTSGFAIIICAVTASAIGALLFPATDESEQEEI